jgi:heme/copper-type cytochrome/quinol oxidase subunit 2
MLLAICVAVIAIVGALLYWYYKSDYYKKAKEKWKKMTPEEKRTQITIIILVIALIMGYSHYSNKIEENNSCMEDCAFEESSCVSDFEFCVWSSYAYSQSRVGYVLSEDYETCESDLDSCSDDLDICVSDCEDS